MTKVLVLYYSSYGHIEKMAGAVAEGARNAGAQVEPKRMPEIDMAGARHQGELVAKTAAKLFG